MAAMRTLDEAVKFTHIEEDSIASQAPTEFRPIRESLFPDTLPNYVVVI